MGGKTSPPLSANDVSLHGMVSGPNANPWSYLSAAPL